jgi:hypothetical protein
VNNKLAFAALFVPARVARLPSKALVGGILDPNPLVGAVRLDE